MDPNIVQDSYMYANMAPPSPEPQKAKKKRVRNWTAEDRAVHREFEKSRREAFSERLTELTNLLPMLRAEQRPSKHVIVDASISYHKTQEARCRQAARVIQSLLLEREELLREVNSLRPLCQASDLVPRQPRPIDPAVLAMLADKGPVVSADNQVKTGTGNIIQQTSLSPVASGVVPLPIQPIQSGLPPPLPQPTYNANDWSWSSPLNPQATSASSPGSMGDKPVSWNTPPGIIAATPPRDLESTQNASTSHLINDSAFFWTQHPSLNTTTPPGDGDFPYSASFTATMPGELPFLWSQNMAMSTGIPSTSEEMMSSNRTFQSTNSFSNPDNLSI